MQRLAAVRKLGKLLGKSLGYRIDIDAPSPEERDEARAALKAALAERDALKERRDVRFKAILAADIEYQTLHAEHCAANERVKRLSSRTAHYKITVGTTSDMFFHVRAEGDTWEEVIAKIENEKQKTAA